jgi:methylase of polypeptide subunit release factors
MAKLTKAQIKAHAAAQELLDSGKVLDFEDTMDVIEGWHEGASHSNAAMSAFFTPYDLAMSMAIQVPTGRILDLCSGIGTLSLAVANHHAKNGDCEFTLVESNPDYCAVARRLLPQARVICGSVFDEDVLREIGTGYDCVISNPPFGTMTKGLGKGPRYRNNEAEYAVIDVASDLAKEGVFILPQQSVPFRQSCDHTVIDDVRNVSEKYRRFVAQTGIVLGPNFGIDCRFAEDQWRGTKIRVEIATSDFRDLQKQRLIGSENDSSAKGEDPKPGDSAPDLLSLMAA